MSKQMTLKIENVHAGDGWAFADLHITVGPITFVVNGIKLVSKRDGGQFVAFPSVKRMKNGEAVLDRDTGKPIYDDIVKVLAEKEIWRKFMDRVRDDFKAALPAEAESSGPISDDDDVPF